MTLIEQEVDLGVPILVDSVEVLSLACMWGRGEGQHIEFVRRRKECQTHGDFIHAPSTSFFHTRFRPSSSSHGHHFVIAATDYFTKWVEAIPMALTDWKGVACLIYTHLLY